MAEEKELPCESEAMDPLYHGEKCKTEVKDTRVYWKALSWCLTVTTLILIVALLAVTILWKVERHNHLRPREQTICIPCTDLPNSQDADVTALAEVSRHYYDDGKAAEICCGHTSGLLSKMVEKYTELKYKEAQPSVYSGCNTGGGGKPAARFAGVMVPNMQQGTANNYILHWNTSSTLSFKKSGIDYHNGRISVTTDGYYYIFCQVKYSDVPIHPGSGTNSDNVARLASDANVQHSLHQISFRHGTEEKLIESSRSQCQIHSKYGNTSTNFMGAVFKLEANDTVFVRSSHPHMLSGCEHGNFFGLYEV